MWQMPSMDGFECVRALRRWEATQADARHTFVVALSANANDNGVAEECLASGFDEVEQKPLTVLKLSRLLPRCL